MSAALTSNINSPWSTYAQEEKRFKRIIVICLTMALLFSLVMPLITVPELDRLEAEKIPPRLAKLLLEKKKIIPIEQPAPEQVKPEEKPPEPEPETKPEPEPEPKPEVKPKPKRDVAEIRKKVANTGVLAMQDMLADLRSQPVEKLKSGKLLQTEGNTKPTTSSQVLMAKASKGSGGIDTSKFSRSISDNELTERERSTVTSEIEAMEIPDEVARETVQGRSMDEITRVMLANYNAIFSIYQRELRKNPLLKGKVLFKMVIEPDGSVSDCTVIDSELNNPQLERKLALRIKRINFGAKDVDTVTINFPIDFLPG